VLLLIALIPIIFLSVVELTASENILPIKFVSIDDSELKLLPERQISLAYYSIATCGFLVAFLALYLVQQNRQVNKRLVFCGYHPWELLFSTLIVLIIIIGVIAVYVGYLTLLFHEFNDMPGFIVGLVLIGFVYGCYGLFVGSLLKKELEGILAIVLLVNIDVGWLQNPVFFTQAENKKFIQFLPGHYPSQSTIIQAFTEYSTYKINLSAILYGLIFLIMAIVVYYYKMRIYRMKKKQKVE
jgi:hypothetical protein